jgi:cell division protein ZapA
MSDRGKQTVTVEIAGQRHTLRSDVAPEYVREVAAHVDRTIRAAAPESGVELQRTAILAALTITDELFRARRELDALRNEVERMSGMLAARLRDAIDEG